MSALSFDKAVLDNDLQVVGERNPGAQSFAAGYFVRTGSRDESADVSGVSHFLEHMMFKGTEARSAEDINREFDELGARYNAFTSDERTVYYGSVLPEKREKLLALLSDMMRPALRAEDFDLEKNVILEEIAMYEDRPNFKVFEEGNARFYRGYPLGNSVLGTAASIRELRREQMLRYFEARYAADNLILVVAGNYDWNAVLDQARELTAAWLPSRAGRSYPEFDPAAGAEELENAKLKRVHIAAYAPGLSAQDPLRYAAAVLSSCLGDASGSRLYWALVDKGLAEAASLSHDSADGAGAFVGYLSTGPENQGEVLDTFRRTLQEVQDDGLSEEEWYRAQRKLATGLTLRGETPFGRLMSLGADYQHTGNYLSVPDLVEAVMGARLEDARALLESRPFDRLYTLSLTPGSSLAPGSSTKESSAPEG